MNKKFCATHHLYYNGVECPMCLSERLNHYDHKYNSKTEDVKQEKAFKKKDREINEDDISKLMEKFNKK